VKTIYQKLKLELNGFHTLLNNAIVRRTSTLNGQDSIMFDGTLSQVESLQNVAKATVSGVQLGVEYFFTPKFSVQTNANWIKGKETDEDKDEQVALRHAPPFMEVRHCVINIKSFLQKLHGCITAR
jgi:hemoglobin/transferrin/lactoferrin receptor protein